MGRLAALVAVLALVGCGGASATVTLPPGKCYEADRQKVVEVLNLYTQRWDDAVELANNTPRNQLSGSIADLQAIRRETDAAAWPVCSSTVKTPLIGMMDATIAGFLDFLAQRDSTANFDKASKLNAEAVSAAKNLAP